jgi:hypothetical protein
VLRTAMVAVTDPESPPPAATAADQAVDAAQPSDETAPSSD